MNDMLVFFLAHLKQHYGDRERYALVVHHDAGRWSLMLSVGGVEYAATEAPCATLDDAVIDVAAAWIARRFGLLEATA